MRKQISKPEYAICMYNMCIYIYNSQQIQHFYGFQFNTKNVFPLLMAGLTLIGFTEYGSLTLIGQNFYMVWRHLHL